VHDSKNVNVNFEEVFRKFAEAVKVTVPEDVSQSLVYRSNQPRTGTYALGTKIFYHRGLDIAGNDPIRPLVSFTVRALASNNDALDEAASFVETLSRVTDADFLHAADSKSSLVHTHLEAKEPSRFNLFVYGNIMVYLDGAIDRPTMKQLTIKAAGILSSATGEVDTIDNQLQITPLKSEDLPMKRGGFFHIDIEVNLRLTAVM
jgi:hypothetical protein